MTNLEINELGRNSEFRKRIQSAILKAANAISGEDPTGKTAIEALKRHNLATGVINFAQEKAVVFANSSSAENGLNSVITINSDDSLNYTGTGTLDGDIDFTVTAVWDDVAGVSYSDKQV